jgi:hypothetical protein
MRVLGPWASHLLLIRTNLGCGTVLMAACARQGLVPLIIIIYYYIKCAFNFCVSITFLPMNLYNPSLHL